MLLFIPLFFGLVSPVYAVNVTLEWVPNSEPNLAGYRVFYREKGQSYDYSNPSLEIAEASCNINNLDENKTYYFVVRAFDTRGFETGDSNEVCLAAFTTSNNQPPTAVVAQDFIEAVSGAIIMLDGSRSTDADDRIASYQWSQIGGTLVELSGYNSETATFIAPETDQSGSDLTFRLTVTDSSGLQSSADCSVYVIPETEPDQFGNNLSPDSVIDSLADNVTIQAGEMIGFSGYGTDPENDLPFTYIWFFGDGSGIPDSSSQNPGMVQFNIPGIYTVTLTVADSQGLSDPSPASRTITVLNNSNRGMIPQDAWSLVFTDSKEIVGEDGAAVNAFDGDPSTYWHTEWDQRNPLPPHEIQINLGGIYDINGFRYLPRQDGGINGTIKQYEFYVSLDGIDWGSPVASGTFAANATEKEVLFPTTTGRFIRLRALSEVNNNRWTSAAEINVLGGPGTGNLSPDSVIDSPADNVTIQAGEMIGFSGYGTDPENDLPFTYVWYFGDGSGIPNSNLQNPGTVQFNIPGVYTVALTVTDSQGLSDPTPASRTVTVLDNSIEGIIPQNTWRLVYVDSEETVAENGAAVNAFDGDPSTYWHTEWYYSNPRPPHEIQIDLGGIYDVNGFRYLPRQDGGINGTISQYEFYVSLDGIDWGSPVATGTFTSNNTEKEVLFPTTTGRFIRLRALSEVNNNRWTSAAEINVLGGPGTGNLSPDSVIDSPEDNVTIQAGEMIGFSGYGTDPENDLPFTYVWYFGDGSGIPNSSSQNPGMVQFNIPGVYTVALTVTDSQGLSDPTPASRTITVLNNSNGGMIPQDAWSLVFTDSEEIVGEDGAAVNAFDGDPSTIWHTEWYKRNPLPPHEIQINLGRIYDINGFRYLPRQDGNINGTIKQYEFYVSLDGIDWGSPVATGTFISNNTEKEVLFPTTTGRFIRLRALSEVYGKPWTSIAEVIVLGK